MSSNIRTVRACFSTRAGYYTMYKGPFADETTSTLSAPPKEKNKIVLPWPKCYHSDKARELASDN